MTPLLLVCPSCDGDRCSDCNGRGRFEIPMCPLLYVTQDVWDVVRMAGLFEKGLPPVAGGVLDQAAIFVEAAGLVSRDTNYWKAKLERNE